MWPPPHVLGQKTQNHLLVKRDLVKAARQTPSRGRLHSILVESEMFEGETLSNKLVVGVFCPA